jgi:hypothetical protein
MLLSTGPADPGGDERSPVFPDWVTDVSADARRTAFETKAPLTAADRDRSLDVYVNVDGTTELVSTSRLLANSPAAAELRGISADGGAVIFTTAARLTRTDIDLERDIYLRRVGSDRTILVSAEAIAPRMKVAKRGPLLASGVALVRVGCPKAETSGPCRGAVLLRRGRSRLGHARFQVPPAKRRAVRVRLRRSLSPSGPVSVLARVRGTDRAGNSDVTVTRVKLVPRARR